MVLNSSAITVITCAKKATEDIDFIIFHSASANHYSRKVSITSVHATPGASSGTTHKFPFLLQGITVAGYISELQVNEKLLIDSAIFRAYPGAR